MLTAGPGWEWVFFVNVPVGVVLLVVLTDCCRRCPPRASAPGSTSSGAMLVTAGHRLAIYALIGAGERGWAAAATLALARRRRGRRTPLFASG